MRSRTNNYKKLERCNRLICGALISAMCAQPLMAQNAGPGSANGAVAGEAASTTELARAERRGGYGEMLRPARRAAAIANRPYAPITKPNDEGQIAEIEMFVGESRVFPTPGVARIAVGNGALLNAAALDGKEVILFANSVGTSSLFIWNADGRYQRLKINIVPGDTTRHAREIAAFLSTIPKAKASVVGANVIVEGDELSDDDQEKIKLLAERYPQIVNFSNRVGWEQMVSMDVKVVEFPVSSLREIGLKWSPTGGAAVAGIWAPIRRGDDGPYQVNIPTGQSNTPPISGVGGGPTVLPRGLNIVGALNLGLSAQLNMLAQEGKAVVLSEPQLSARNGASAEFLAGGEIPYAVASINGSRVEFKPYGIRLKITPRVDRNGVIRAKIYAEVSSIDPALSVPAGPALLKRLTETEFNLREGESLVLSGLLQRDSNNAVDKIPLLGDVPVLGALFRSKRYQNKETELVVFVTPTLVNAQSAGNVDRIQRTTDRLEQRLGPKPFLTEPLQPGISYERPNALPGAAVAAATGDMAPQPQPPPQRPQPQQPVQMQAPPPALAAAPVVPVPPNQRALAQWPADSGSSLTVIAESTALRARPSARSALLLSLNRGATVALGPADAKPPHLSIWRNVVVGAVHGWLPSDTVAPTALALAERQTPSVEAQQSQQGAAVQQPLRVAAGATGSAGRAGESGNAAGSAGGVPTPTPTPAAGSLGPSANPSPIARSAAAPAPAPSNLTLDAASSSAAQPLYRVGLKGLALRITPDVNSFVIMNLRVGTPVTALAEAPRGAWTAVQVAVGNHTRRGWVSSQWLLPLATQAAVDGPADVPTP